jgi:hypothetical protein
MAGGEPRLGEAHLPPYRSDELGSDGYAAYRSDR